MTGRRPRHLKCGVPSALFGGGTQTAAIAVLLREADEIETFAWHLGLALLSGFTLRHIPSPFAPPNPDDRQQHCLLKCRASVPERGSVPNGWHDPIQSLFASVTELLARNGSRNLETCRDEAGSRGFRASRHGRPGQFALTGAIAAPVLGPNCGADYRLWRACIQPQPLRPSASIVRPIKR